MGLAGVGVYLVGLGGIGGLHYYYFQHFRSVESFVVDWMRVGSDKSELLDYSAVRRFAYETAI